MKPARGFTETITVLICDAQPLFAEALSVALTRFPGFRVLDERPASAAAVIEAVRRHRPDVTLLDYWLDPSCSKEAMVGEALSSGSSTKVLVLSSMHSKKDIEAVLGAGASGFVPKGVRVSRLAEAVLLASQGKPVFPDELRQLADRVEREDERAASFWRLFETLTPRELEIVSLLAEGKSKKQIGDVLSISPHTVRTHLARIFKKTQTDSQLDLITRARAHGLV